MVPVMIFHIHFSSIKLLITQRGQVHGLYLKFSDDGPFNKNYSPNDGAKSMDFSQSLLMMDSLIKLFTQGWGKVHGLFPKFTNDGQFNQTIHPRMGQSPWTFPKVY